MDVALKLSFCICSFKNTNTKWLRKGITCHCTEKRIKKTSNIGGIFDERRSRNSLFSIQVTSLKFNRWDIILTVYLWIKLDNEPISCFTSQFHVGSQAIGEKREWTKLCFLSWDWLTRESFEVDSIFQMHPRQSKQKSVANEKLSLSRRTNELTKIWGF